MYRHPDDPQPPSGRVFWTIVIVVAAICIGLSYFGW
jgi:hypothetical protein